MERKSTVVAEHDRTPFPVRRNGLWAAAGLGLAGAGSIVAFGMMEGATLATRLIVFALWMFPAVLSLTTLWQLSRAAAVQHKARRAIESRSSTVDRLLEFSQTIQGAGKAEQVTSALAHYLPTELKLAGLAILSVEPGSLPAVSVEAAWPDPLFRAEQPVQELDTALCPCFRQSLPRHFRPDGAPVRCAIDQCLSLPADHPAFCIPFNVGPRRQVLVHMLLPVGAEWTDDLKHLAQTYVNAATSSLITLHHLTEAERQSMTDVLTGLYNRRSMEQLLSREVALADRHNQPLSIVMIDMDYFKEVNDAHGHAAGDHLLRAFADCVRMTLRKTDLAFRYGGDEFVVALPQTTVTQAQQVVQKLRQAFSAADFSDAIAHLEHQPTLSIGVAQRDPSSNLRDLASILAAADQALYDAKANDRNCVMIFQPKAA